MLPTRERTADVLARRHGYRTVKELASSLPPRAAVLDVGAGVSSLGSVVATLRPDVRWINWDFSYHDKRTLKDVRQGTPSNLTFIAGDATRLDRYIAELAEKQFQTSKAADRRCCTDCQGCFPALDCSILVRSVKLTLFLHESTGSCFD
jgi:hypothetical protein